MRVILDLITSKRNEIEKLKQEIALLESDIEPLKLTEEYSIRFNTWYKTVDNTIFFRPVGVDDGCAVGFSVSICKNNLAYDLNDACVDLEKHFYNMKESSFDEMLNTVNLHNLEILEQYK